MTNRDFQYTMLYQHEVVELLQEANKSMTALEVARKIGITTQRAAAILHTLSNLGVIYRKNDGDKIKYSFYDFGPSEDLIYNYEYFSNYKYIVVHKRKHASKYTPEKGYNSQKLAIISAEIMSLINKKEYYVIENK